MTKLKLALITLGGALLAFVGIRANIRKDAQEDLKHEIEQETSRRVEAGREAVAAGRVSGSSPAERVRNNDDKWRRM
jgi:hypothetical protein